VNALAHVVLLGWAPTIVVLFMVLPHRRAVIVGFLVAWLLLPNGGYNIPGFPDYTKMSATTAGVALAALLFDTRRVLSWRPGLIDLPMLLLCLSPLPSGILNGYGLYHSAADVLDMFVRWGFPYLIGRVYLADRRALRELAVGVVIGGLIYVPLCVFEARMSPLLHYWVYGYRPHAMKVRDVWFFGPLCYTPIVFVDNYLGLTLMMGGVAIAGTWLWATGSVKRLMGVPMAYVVPALWVGAVVCKAWGANLIWLAGLTALFLNKVLRTRLPLLLFLLVPPVYMSVRATGVWSGRDAIELVRPLSKRRAESLAVRIENETMLTRKALKKPVFGWGPWGEYRVRSEQGVDISLTDGLWVICLGKYGIVGLASLTLAFLLPAGLLLCGLPRRCFWLPQTAHLGTFAVWMAVRMTDGLFNAHPQPLFTLALGGLSGLVASLLSRSPALQPLNDISQRASAFPTGAPLAKPQQPPARRLAGDHGL